jgi:hypothetical protein
MSTHPRVFSWPESAPFKPAVILGQGLPADVNGQPAAYFWKEMLPPGNFHDAKGKPFEVDAKRIDTLIACFNRAKAKGYRPFLPAGSHRERQKNYGFLIDVRKNARGVLEGLHQFIGEDAIREASRNKSSICTVRDVTDETGEHYEELIDHNCILPDPQMSGLGDFQPFNPALAASRGQNLGAVEYLELAASTQETVMDLTALRKAVGAADTVPDADVITQAATKLGTIPALEQARTTAEGERDTARTELSRRQLPKEPDPDVIADRAGVKLERIEHLATTGAISAQQADFLKKRVNGADGKPNVLMLSKAPGADESPVDALLAFAAMGKAGVKADGEAQTGVQELSRQRHDHSGVTGGGGGKPDLAKAAEEARKEGEAWQAEQQRSRGWQSVGAR